MHAGGEDGWIEGADLVFQSKKATGDYHDESNPQPKYVIDELAKAPGHEVVRLPPYHCELNSIEFCWSQVKGHIRA